MRVEVEILNGFRKGLCFFLAVEQNKQNTQSIKMPFVLETEAIAFRLTTHNKSHVPRLFFHGILREFTHQNISDNGSIIHEFLPKWENGYYETFFYNYFGTVFIDLEVTENQKTQLFYLMPFEVLAKKTSASQAEKMISFIIAQTQGNLQDIPGATFFSNSELNIKGSQPQTLIDQIQKNISILETVTPHIIQHPISVLSTKLQLKEGRQVTEITEQGIDWLTANMHVLKETGNDMDAHLALNGTYYMADELCVPITNEQTDIYENRLIHGFIIQILTLTTLLIKKYEETLLKRNFNSYNGYVSFFESMKKALLRLNDQCLEQARTCRKKLLYLKTLYERYIPVTRPENARPRITPRIRQNSFYLMLFQSMATCYEHTEINWRSLGLWLAIDNIPKLFEYYTTLRIASWCKRALKGFSLTGENKWEGRAGDYLVTLYYEPVYWMTGHIHAGNIVNTEHHDLSSSEFDEPDICRFGEHQNRSPDLVLTIKKEGQREFSRTFILDAKYTTREKSFDIYLPQCTMKYVHGIANTSGNTNILAMIILYPDDEERLLDFHAYPFNAYGSKPQIPVLGVQAVSVDSGMEQNKGLERLLLRLFELSERQAIS